MGLFLMMSGVIGSEPSNVHNALRAYAEQKSIMFELKDTTDKPGTPGIGIISQNNQNITVLYPEDFSDWDEASQFISKYLSKPVFSLHIHDGDLWMYILFNNGQEADWFNPLPEYWEKLPENEKDKWKGNAERVAQLIPSVSADAIKKYLVEWDLKQEKEGMKAYPDDEFAKYDCWQVVDFMKKTGLKYPDGDEIPCETFYLGKKPKFNPTSKKTISNEKKPSKKPWWKIW